MPLEFSSCQSNTFESSEQLNAAKGRLRTVLHRGLYRPIEPLFKDASCLCRKETLYDYQSALHATGVWPLEELFIKTPMDQILSRLSMFKYVRTGAQCRTCGKDYEMAVRLARRNTESYFEGLCLDCMNKERPKFGDDDEDYWHHNRMKDKWDESCRLTHGQPTWYFSFMGRRAKKTIA